MAKANTKLLLHVGRKNVGCATACSSRHSWLQSKTYVADTMRHLVSAGHGQKQEDDPDIHVSGLIFENVIFPSQEQKNLGVVIHPFRFDHEEPLCANHCNLCTDDIVMMVLDPHGPSARNHEFHVVRMSSHLKPIEICVRS
jgi:hypothetical protein